MGKSNQAVEVCKGYKGEVQVLEQKGQVLKGRVKELQGKLEETVAEVERLNNILQGKQADAADGRQLRQELVNVKI